MAWACVALAMAACSPEDATVATPPAPVAESAGPSERARPISAKGPAAPDVTLDAHTRDTLSIHAREDGGPLRLDLVVEVPAPPTELEARVVRMDGERHVTRARLLADAPTRYRLDVPLTTLGRGLHLIELEGAADHPLSLRRFVLEIRD